MAALLERDAHLFALGEHLAASEKTVGHHVSAILGKLGVRSRYDAAKLAAEDRELAPPR